LKPGVSQQETQAASTVDELRVVVKGGTADTGMMASHDRIMRANHHALL